MSCHYYLKKKGRYCLNKTGNNHYCHLHQKVHDKQSGGTLDGNNQSIDPYISPYALISSQLPVDPPQHSWYHYQAPVYQSFGDYVCIKKSFINNAKDLLNEVFTEQKPLTR